MPPAKTLMILLAALPFLVGTGCTKFGQVNQGRVIQYDREKGLVTLIQDSNYKEPGNPKFDILPPATIRIPTDPQEMGPAPEAGKLMRVDFQNRQVVIYHADSQGFKTIAYTPLEQHHNVFRDHPRVAGARFPRVDREKKTVTLYSARQRKLVTFSVPDEYLALPDDTWKAGDEIRYYYKDPGQALRLMNVTKTDLTKSGK